MSELALVTGGAGFIGSHVVRSLLKRNYKVRVLALESEPIDRLEGLDVEIHRGDLLDPDVLGKALEGCRYLFHLAAIHAQWMKDFDPMYRVNVNGTRQLMELALKMKVQKVVYTSTQNIIGIAKNGRSDENTPFHEFEKSSHYTRSKFLAEQEVLKLSGKGLPVVIVNPSGPVGEGDTGPTGHVIIQFLNKKIPFFFYGFFNIIDVLDLAEGHVLALEKGRPGERYILAGQDLSIREFFSQLERLSGVKAPKIQIPRWIAMVLGYVFEFVSDRITHKAPKMSVDRVRTRGRKKLLSIKKAQNELGLPHTPLDETLNRAIQWYRTHGYAPPSK